MNDALFVFVSLFFPVFTALLLYVGYQARETDRRVSRLAERFIREIREVEDRMVTRILVGESLIRVQTEPTSPLFNPDRGLVPALSFGPVDFILYRAADYDEPLLCCQHGGPLVEGEEFYLISLNNAPDPGAVLAVCLPCHQEEKRRVLGT